MYWYILILMDVVFSEGEEWGDCFEMSGEVVMR